MTGTGRVLAVSSSPVHAFSKEPRSSVRLVVGLGIEGDSHAGSTVQHRSRAAQDPTQPNLRQVHLVHAELHDELRAAGFAIQPGDMGENVTTRDVDLLSLPTGTRLHLGACSVVELTGLRNPCRQLDQHQQGLMSAVLDRTPSGELIRKAGVMAVVVAGGEVGPGDEIRVERPPGPHRPLERV